MSASASFSRIPRLLLGIGIGIAMTVLIAAAPVRAQGDSPTTDGRLQVVDAHIEGTGPWTSIFGAAPDRELVINITNTGSVPIEAPELVLTFGKGANPTGSLAPPQIGRLEPGESTVVRTTLDLPSFAYGTYAVEGSFPGFDPPVQFRAETSQIPWLLFIAPLLILGQLGLITLRNAVRRRIHAPAGNIAPRPNESPAEIPGITREMIDLRADSISIGIGDLDISDLDIGDDIIEHEPQPSVELEPEPSVGLDTIIGEELGVAFGRAFMNHGECSDHGEFVVLVVSLTNAAAERVAERAQLSRSERDVLGFEMAQAVLATFDLPAEASI